MITYYLFREHSPMTITENPKEIYNILKDGDNTYIWACVEDKSEIKDISQMFGINQETITYVESGLNSHDFYSYENSYHNFRVPIYRADKLDLDVVEKTDIHVILSERFIITIASGESKELVEFSIKRFSNLTCTKTQRAMLPVCVLMDSLISSYFSIVGLLDDSADEIEAEILSLENKDQLDIMKRIHKVRSLGRDMRMRISPMRELVANLGHLKFADDSKKNMLYLQDISARLSQLLIMIEQVREILLGVMDVYMDFKSDRLNEIMKILTVFSTLFMPITFITGYWGMNFSRMPGLHSGVSFVIMTIVIIALPIGMYFYFKRKNWF